LQLLIISNADMLKHAPLFKAKADPKSKGTGVAPKRDTGSNVAPQQGRR
jgi:hypothetical protein